MKDATEIVCIIDRSGSMDYVKEDAVGGLNTFLTEQKKNPKEANITFVLFDDHYEVPYSGSLHEAPEFCLPSGMEDAEWVKKITFIPRGRTALLDAIGKAVKDTGNKLAALPEQERPSKVVVAVMTDGKENASKRYSFDQVAAMRKHQSEVYNWDFLFLASDLDASEMAGLMGIVGDANVRFRKGKAAMQGALAGDMCRGITKSRG